MRFINPKFHAIVDYASGVIMIFLPELTRSADQPQVKWLAIAAGIVILLQAMLTRYEGGVIGLIQLYMHLIVDVILGVGLMLSAWFAGMQGIAKTTFLVMGILAILFGTLTRLNPFRHQAYQIKR